MKKIDAKGRLVLIIPDLHIPYHHPDAFNFLAEIKAKYLDKRSIIINLGDEIDGHTISFHDNDPDLPYSPSAELEKAIDYIQDLQEIFPKQYICESNHSSLVYRRAKKHGIPMQYIKPYKEWLKTPKYEWHEDYLLQTKMGDIYICHGKTSANGKLSKEMGTFGAIQGHFHGKFQILWSVTATATRFDAFSGCLIDRESLAYAYGKNHIPKPILGCLSISKMGYPQMIKMILNEKGRWIWDLP